MSQGGSPGAYRGDLAFIHDAGFGFIADNGAKTLVQELRSRGVNRGVVVELGCGSGISAEIIAKAGYELLGFDISAAMVELAQRRVPTANFQAGSFVDAELPPCIAVTAFGEIFNYLFDERNSAEQLPPLFHRIFRALQPGGLLLFDLATPGRVPGDGRTRSFTEGDGWACLYAAEEDREHRILTRRITTFRKADELYRRDHEVHRLQLYPRQWIANELKGAGFDVRELDRYHEFVMPPGLAGFLASKP
jgi:SAM-dependent methyltransferase